MPEIYTQDAATFTGVVDVEAAEALHQQLLQRPNLKIEYDGVEHVHAAVVQVLLAHRMALPECLFPVTKKVTES